MLSYAPDRGYDRNGQGFVRGLHARSHPSIFENNHAPLLARRIGWDVEEGCTEVSFPGVDGMLDSMQEDQNNSLCSV